MAPNGCLFPVLVAVVFFAMAAGVPRSKRASDGDDAEPKIITQSGHLIFQTGANHNISFRTEGTGKVVVGNEDLLQVVAQVKTHETKITNLENNQGNPDPGGNLETQVNANKNDISALQSRVSQLEGGGGGTPPPTDLAQRVTTLETKIAELIDALELDECSSNPCQHGGTCINLYNKYQCRCPPEWEGPTCDQDVNECAMFAGTQLGCQNGATCVNQDGGYRCDCPANYYGIHCTESHNDCTGASSYELCGHGTCLNLERPPTNPDDPKFMCLCDAGYTTVPNSNNPACTQDIDECSDTNIHPCSHDPLVPCINVPGSFYCGQCPTGYSGNGFQCSDINECNTNNGGCSTSPLVTCVNTIGSRICSACPAGYEGDGITCTYVGICNQNNGGCSLMAICENIPSVSLTYRTCTCMPGYTGTGVGSDGCTPSEPVISCRDNPCVNGICRQQGTSYTCTCNPGWSGENCDQNDNECSSSPCQNGGTCVDDSNGYTCNCDTGFTGDNCESAAGCGGVLTGESGSFRFPTDGTSTYPHASSCAWRITTTRGMVLSITFPSFNLEYHSDCNFDFLQIHDGADSSAYLIGQFCGAAGSDTAPTAFISTHNVIYLWFRSDTSVSSDGFSVQWTSVAPECGGDITGETYGSINSPGYPGVYPHDIDCVWLITVDPNSVITFAFGTLSLETHDTCQYDFLEILDGLTDASTSLGKYCSTIIPAPVTTSGPYAYVRFHTDATNNDQGFHITWTSGQSSSGCGGRFTDDSAILISPDWPNPYPHHSECIWFIDVHEGETIQFTITDLDLESHSNCRYDYIEVRDGIDETAAFIGRYCGQDLPPTVTSSGSQLWVKFVSDGSTAGAGFRAEYTIECGGVFTASFGELTSPYFPDVYPSDKSCEYIIRQPAGNIITLTFVTFDIEGGLDTCDFDYLEIRDGESSDSPLISTLCGTSVPAPIITTQNNMYLKFVSDGSLQNHGFRARYSISEGGNTGQCGGSFTDSADILTSPSHPDSYPHGAHCVYTIQAAEGYVIRLTFNSFQLEYHANCNYDYVAVYDNCTDPGCGERGRYCGLQIPPVITSIGNVMTLIFVSDSSVASEGFSASYITLDATFTCGGDVSASSGVITSLNYPENYPTNRECIWTITAPNGNQIMVNITDIDIELHSSCNYDYLEIRNGGYASSPLIGTFCGDSANPRSFPSHSNRLYIKFKTDGSRSGRGFRLEYDATSTGCGSELTGASGSFTSPNYPMPYGHNAICRWLINISAGSVVQLFFVHFDMERHSTCNYDYVRVYDGDSEDAAQIGNFCGSQTPLPVTSTSNVMFVKFRTDFSNSGGGFYASYHGDCNQEITGFDGVIESPNFPNPYPHSRDCTWTIKASLGNKINMTFTHFHLEDHSACQYDYLQIRDGEDEDADEIGRFCGQDVPGTYSSSSEAFWIHFVADPSVGGNGFRLEWVLDGCGGEFFGPSGSITSPNYPNQYPRNKECIWKITVAPGNSIQLTVNDIDLEGSTGCRFDALKIHGGPDEDSPLLATLCNTNTADQHVASTGNHMYLKLTSDNSLTGNGFRLTYTEIEGGCGGNYSASSGVIHSKNYPSDYAHNSDCNWLITVQQFHRVLLSFTDFDVEQQAGETDCAYDYVHVYNGPDENSPLLLSHCGSDLPPDVESSSNQLYVRMRSDSSVSGRGFSATYNTGCGGFYDATIDGAIQSPNYPERYDANSNCSWILESSHLSDRVTLTFTAMDLESHAVCMHDAVTVYDGNDAEAPLIGSYCGSTIPAAITSTGNALYVVFHSDRSVQRLGFFARYTTSTSACGGDYNAVSGAFNSPMYPNNYPLDTECVWTLSTSPGNRIHLAFSLFDIEPSVNCQNDYIEVRKFNQTGDLIGRYCGNTVPSNVTVATVLWVKFRSNSQGTGIGFMGNYAMVPGGDFTGDSGVITSPRYPDQYPTNIDSIWTITVVFGMRIRVTFTDMDIESTTYCRYDYLVIRDGPTEDSIELDRLCGSVVPEVPIYSSGSSLYITFHSDFSITKRGFRFEWLAVTEGPTVTPTISPGTCGRLTLQATNTPQVFTSPGYPNGYAPDLDCYWQFTTETGSKVQIKMTDVNLEGGATCPYDGVFIYDGLSTDSDLLGQYCGVSDNNSPVTSAGTAALVNFVSDVSTNGTGFSGTYRSVCGGRITSNTGILTSPGYPDDYPVNVDCSWIIESSTATTLWITFDAIDIQNSASCNNDYIQLFNGENDDSPLLGKYCGSSLPAAVQTSGNLLHVRFVSDGNAGSGFSGFSIRYQTTQAGCGGVLTLTDGGGEGILTSPNYPENYPPNSECEWTIHAPVYEAIQLDFTDFVMESHVNCNYDYLQIRDGATSESPLLQQVCGTNMPDTIRSSANVMYLKFRSDGNVAKKGFRLIYSIATCGGTLSGETGTLLSPNYPNNYDDNMLCDWYIRGPTGHYLSFTFVAFSVIGSGDDCSVGDYLEISERNLTDIGPSLGKFCGTTLPAVVETSDSYAHITLSTDSTTKSTGFQIEWTASVEECGGELTTPTGVITSPNYPGQYAHSRNCIWHITVLDGHRISLEFTDIRLEANSRCSYDYIQVYNGINVDAPQLGRYCDGIPAPVESSGNMMTIRFVSDGSVSLGGFRAEYSSVDAAVCGGTYTASPGDQGIIFSPNEGIGNYTNDLQCIWVINNEAEHNSSIIIDFTTFDVEEDIVCNYDYVEIRMGSESSAPLYGRYCGSNLPSTVMIPTRSAWIVFRTDSSDVAEGFRASWKVSACGGLYDASEGVITSPNYPLNYNHNDMCMWFIQTSPGSTITVNFTQFIMESHPDCRYDYLSARNGGHPDSPQISGEIPWCGREVPSAFTTSSNQLILILKTDASSSAKGFRMGWTTSSSGCGGNYHSDTGTISSSNFPNNYNINEECIWTITVEHGYHVSVTFTEFRLQQSGGCSLDYVEVRDGDSSTSSQLGRYCGTRIPSSLQSTRNVMRVKFHSDSSTVDSGFRLTWSPGCGAVFDELAGRITSPGYGIRNYPDDLDCGFLINFEPDVPLIIRFEDDFDIEAHGSCNFDYVAIYSGTSESGELLAKVCGSVAPDELSLFGPAFIMFHTDSSSTAAGFAIDFEVGCGGNFTAPDGIIQTPAHLDRYKPQQNCSWFVQVDPIKVIELRWEMIDIELHSACNYDYVEVFDGHSYSSPSLTGRLCGEILPDPIITTSNLLLAQFVSDYSIAGEGFRAAYRATYGPTHGCGNRFTNDTGSFSSVDIDGDNNYENDLDCVWIISVDVNKVIRLSFSSNFMLEEKRGCLNDYIEVRDGVMPTSSLIGRYCGLSAPPSMTTSGNNMHVLFHTDSVNRIPFSGFTASYTTLPRTCGGVLNATTTAQIVTSPNYPGNYGPRMRCRWTVDAPENERVKLTITHLDIESHDNCQFDFVEFRDSPMYTGGQSLRFCGGEIPSFFESSSRTAEINFHTDANSHGAGFRIEYEIAGCSKALMLNNGRLTSPNYPNNYPSHLDCQVTITSPPGTKIALYFNTFQMEYHINCNYDYLQIYDGDNMTSPVLGKLCGSGSLPDPIFASGNLMFVRFVTDRSVALPGYEATFTSTSSSTSGCGGNFTVYTGSFTSPGFPGSYGENLVCEWLVTVPAGRQPVSIEFTWMNIEGTSGVCSNDKLEIWDGDSQENGSPLGSFCGSDLPANRQSQLGRSMFFRFTTDSTTPDGEVSPGFRIKFNS